MATSEPVGLTFAVAIPAVPEEIRSLSDAAVRDQATDAWRSAASIRLCIDTWRSWFSELERSGTADPTVPAKLTQACSAAIFSLCSMGAFTPSFRGGTPSNLLSILPPLPFSIEHAGINRDGAPYLIPSGNGWESNETFLKETRDQLALLRDLQGECLAICNQLQLAPTVVLGWGERNDCPEVVRDHSKLKDEEKYIIQAIDELWGRGQEWPGVAEISKQSGVKERVVKELIAPMARHEILEKGPSDRGFRVLRT